ncbi:hypothetical protein RchiOBHm_Chr6g0249731 [Rosa chinensis]|uniref:C-JID domain-containing protein n=1 Tax=Rosa chinensis TaxID=74649 RepID=A0A2P6PKD0_ROSCH|nr:hypothetical protein RchiOBHm_Chr6g0249731 [Rosa chinensis]
MGFAWCVVFRLLKPLSPLVRWSINCDLTVNKQLRPNISLWLGGKWGEPVVDHIWFFCAHRDEYSHQHEWQDIYYQLEFSFKLTMDEEDGDAVEIPQVKKCGVRVIYEEDVEELWQTLSKQSNTKRCLQHYDDDDAASMTSQEEEEEPPPKRFKRLKLDGAGPSDQKHG